jgi:penicillin-insensitive murein DD-endopeptidase
MKRLLSCAALLLPLAAIAADRGWTRSSRWSAIQTPKRGPAKSIGAYNAGCIQGAVALPPAGPGFEVMHLGRHRYFGHPVLVGFVRRLATRAADVRLPVLLVGDLGQARGGPTPTDHGSHQTGLDVDIAYTRPIDLLQQPIPPQDREGLKPPPVVDLASGKLTAAWRPQVGDLLELAASDPAVDRIFVNAAVKQELCTHLKPGAPWLHKLRPWWKHHDHFHVRLHCPPGSSMCRPQPAVPPGTGCDETLDWWLQRRVRPLPAVPRPGGTRLARAPLPKQCQQVLR